MKAAESVRGLRSVNGGVLVREIIAPAIAAARFQVPVHGAITDRQQNCAQALERQLPANPWVKLAIGGMC